MHPMLVFFVPPTIREVYFLFKDLFEEQGFSYLTACSYLVFFLFGFTNFSDFARCCPWCPSVSSLGRLASAFEPNRFMRRNRQRLLKKMATCGHCDFCFAVDDTANPKYGSRVFASSPFGSSSGPFFGQKILVLVVVDLRTRQAYPISYVFLSGKKDPNHVPAPTRAVELIANAIGDGFPPLPVTADSWFGSKEFIQAVYNLGCDFAGELKMNRKASTSTEKECAVQNIVKWFSELKRHRLPKSRHQKRKEKRGKAFSEKLLYITGLNQKLKIIAVYNRINGATPFAIYATTDLSMTGAKLWKLSRARWSIECLFRNLKQSLGFGGLTAGGEGGAHLAVCLPLILATSIRLDASEIWDSAGDETLGTIVKKQREASLAKAIDLAIHNHKSPRLQRLQARRKNPNQKPTNISGGKLTA
jgi:hypothetical protein